MNTPQEAKDLTSLINCATVPLMLERPQQSGRPASILRTCPCRSLDAHVVAVSHSGTYARPNRFGSAPW